jgi:O-methyltransferase
VRTGRTAFEDEFGTDFFSYLDSHPELSAMFNGAMSQGTQLTAALLPTAYDFDRFRTVVDIGGGDGTLIAAILRAHPALRGILFDTPGGLGQAEATLRQATVLDRCEIRSGDFFTCAPAGGDLYLLKSVIHDWDDERATTILGHCRRAIADGGRLLIIESVLPETVDASVSPITYLSDLNMMVNLGGRERTRADFDQLCRQAGFTLTTVTPLPPRTPFCLIEATPS